MLPYPPVNGPIVRGFEAPASRFDPGHRGLDIAVPPGTPVHAAADGTVVFAGVVAGSRFVTIAHPDLSREGPLETTYSFLSRIGVRPGSTVNAGDVVGTSGTGHPGSTRPALHFGVRRSGRYVDPAPMLRLRQGRDDVSDLVSLGPLPLRDAASAPAARGPSHRDAAEGIRPAGAPGEQPAGAGPARTLAPQPQCGEGGDASPAVFPSAAELRAGARPPAAPNDNAVIAVAGIGSWTRALPAGLLASGAAMYQLDLTTLGYAADRIFHFSYRGVPAPGRPDTPGPYRFHLPYEPRNTLRPIAESAALLEQLVGLVHAAAPARRIDLVAHSQGGVVAQYYLEHLYDPARPGGPVIDHLVTIASPHFGADLAGLGARLGAAGTSPSVLLRVARAAEALGAPPPGSPAAADLAVGSPAIGDLTRRWRSTPGTGTVATTTIAAGLDLVVPPQRTRLPGASHYTVDVSGPRASLWAAHAAIVGATRTKQIVYGALANRPAPCTTLQDMIADSVTGPLISAIEGRFLELLTEAAAPASVRSPGAPAARRQLRPEAAEGASSGLTRPTAGDAARPR
jgi:hypothetical protein